MIDRWRALGCAIVLLSFFLTAALIGRVIGALTGHNSNEVR